MPNDLDSGARLRAQYNASGGVHQTFSAKVTDYLASRPDYPAALFEQLRRLCGLAPGAVVADIGAGTGLLTKDLLAQAWLAIAVEPNDEMRAAADSLLGLNPSYRSINGSAEASGLADHSVDLITATQAFHWFDLAATAREFRRVLQPGAMVALIWNDRVLDDPLNLALDQLLDRFGGSKRAALVAHEQGRDVALFFGGEPLHRLQLPHQHRLSGDALLSLVFSRSYMPARDSVPGEAVSKAIGNIVRAHADNGSVSMRYRTDVLVGVPVESALAAS